MADNSVTLKLLNNGLQVLAKYYKNELCALTYANRRQAYAKMRTLGDEWWYIWQAPSGRPFYIVRTEKQERNER